MCPPCQVVLFKVMSLKRYFLCTCVQRGLCVRESTLKLYLVGKQSNIFIIDEDAALTHSLISNLVSFSGANCMSFFT